METNSEIAIDTWPDFFFKDAFTKEESDAGRVS